jgi:predicted phage-related endonuclease
MLKTTLEIKREIMTFNAFKKEIKNRRRENAANSFKDSPTSEINEHFGQGCTKFHRSLTC